MVRRWISVGLGVALFAAGLVACGGDDRTIEISALDEFRFDPDEVTVQASQEVPFVITNDGEIVHEFVLGPEMVQMAHEEAMAEGEEMDMDMEGQLAAVELDPGETAEVTVTFPEPGEMPYGCHEPGHFDAGMFGTVIVE